jgi:hypothetical protein
VHDELQQAISLRHEGGASGYAWCAGMCTHVCTWAYMHVSVC